MKVSSRERGPWAHKRIEIVTCPLADPTPKPIESVLRNFCSWISPKRTKGEPEQSTIKAVSVAVRFRSLTVLNATNKVSNAPWAVKLYFNELSRCCSRNLTGTISNESQKLNGEPTFELKREAETENEPKPKTKAKNELGTKPNSRCCPFPLRMYLMHVYSRHLKAITSDGLDSQGDR